MLVFKKTGRSVVSSSVKGGGNISGIITHLIDKREKRKQLK